MSRITKIFALLIFYYLIAIVLPSCCRQEWTYRGILNIYAVDSLNFVREPIDTIKNEIILHVEYDVLISSLAPSLLPSAYATSCDDFSATRLNDLDSETIAIRLSQDIEYAGNSVSAGSNLLDVDMIKEQFEFDDFIFSDFRFGSPFYQQAVFPKGDYEIDFSITTTDDQVYRDTVAVYIDL